MADKHSKCESLKPFIKLKNDMGSEDVYYSIFYEDIPNEFSDVALKELDETGENKRIGLLKLRDFLKGKNISGVEDQILLTVLRNCKYNIKKSEKKLMKFLQTQDMITKWLQTVDLQRLESVFNHRVIGVLPFRDKHGRPIIFSTPYDIDLTLFEMDEAALGALCLLMYVLTYPLTSVVGLAYIGECKTPAISIMYPVVKTYRKFLTTILSLPFRIGKVDVINENCIIRWGYNLASHLIPSKVIQRIKFHGGDIQGLQKFYHPALLPEEFGGTMGPMNPKVFTGALLNFIEKLKSRNLYL